MCRGRVKCMSKEAWNKLRNIFVQLTKRPRDLSLASALTKVMLFFQRSLCVSLLKKLISEFGSPSETSL